MEWVGTFAGDALVTGMAGLDRALGPLTGGPECSYLWPPGTGTAVPVRDHKFFVTEVKIDWAAAQEAATSAGETMLVLAPRERPELR